MGKRKGILIGCPQYRRYVRGTYETDEAGRYRLGPDGQFLLELARCGQCKGRCAQTLCVLHRYNRLGPGAWYPSCIRAMPESRRPPRPPGTSGPTGDGAWWA